MKDLQVTPNAPICEEQHDIVVVNTGDTSEEFDYDFDYDPNEMYYALNGGKN